MDNEAELTNEAKAAIQSYMFKFFIPSATVVSIISAAAGFGLDRVARDDAYTEAFKNVAPKMYEAQVKAETAGTKAEFIVDELDKNVKKKSADANQQSEKVAKLIEELTQKGKEITAVVNNNFEGLAISISANKHFQEEIFRASQAELKKIKSRIDYIGDRRFFEGVESISDVQIYQSPVKTISGIIGYEPDYCAITKVEVGNINSLCRVFRNESGWQIASGRDSVQIACTATCIKFRLAPVEILTPGEPIDLPSAK